MHLTLTSSTHKDTNTDCTVRHHPTKDPSLVHNLHRDIDLATTGAIAIVLPAVPQPASARGEKSAIVADLENTRTKRWMEVRVWR